jgi:hypothetical protein
MINLVVPGKHRDNQEDIRDKRQSQLLTFLLSTFHPSQTLNKLTSKQIIPSALILLSIVYLQLHFLDCQPLCYHLSLSCPLHSVPGAPAYTPVPPLIFYLPPRIYLLLSLTCALTHLSLLYQRTHSLSHRLVLPALGKSCLLFSLFLMSLYIHVHIF